MYRLEEDLYLLPLTPSMAEELCQLVGQNRAYLSRWLPWVPHSQQAAHFLAFIDQTISEREAQKSLVLALQWRGDLVGVAGFNKLDWQLGVAELGYWLAADKQGNGLMSKACNWLVSHAFNDLHMAKVQLSAAVDNKPSRRIAKRLGMVLEGVIRRRERVADSVLDHAVYGLLREEWK